MQRFLPRPAPCQVARIEIRIAFRGRKGTGWALLACLIGAVAAPLAAQVPPACRDGRTALVLSGGGAKGIAHIEVLRVLERLGGRPDLIVGTSIGSIIGALYASGYSPAAIDSLARVLEPDRLFAASEPRPPRAWRPLAPLLVWEQGSQGLSLRSPTVQEAEANGLLATMLLRGNVLAGGRFDALPIPFRAVATDLATREPVVLDHGDLGQAVRASIAVPLVFPPERIEGRLLSDGGLSANIPVGIARRLGATRVIVVDVTGPLLPADRLGSPFSVAEQLAGFLFQQPRDSLRSGDLYVRVDVAGFTNLDFSPASLDSLRAHGRAAAEAVLPQAACLPHGVMTPRTPPAWVHGVTVAGGIPSDQRSIARFLGLEHGGAWDETLLATRLRHLHQFDAYKAVWLHPAGQGDTTRFEVQVERAPDRLAGLALAYDNDLGGRLGLAFLDRHLFGTGFEGSATAGLSRLKSAFEVAARRPFGFAGSRLVPAVIVRAVEERIIRYSEDGQETGRPTTREADGFAGLEQEFGDRWVGAIGVDGRIWRDVDSTGQRAGGPTGNGGGLAAALRRDGGAMRLEAGTVWSATWQRTHAELAVDYTNGRLTLTPRVRVGWGEGLALQHRFPLGGDEGFPGLAVEELRGDRELFGAVQGSWHLRGPLSARLLLAAGRSADGGALLDDSDWLAGVRAGLGIDTAIGPVRFEYGVSSSGRDLLFVRIGRWF